MLNRSEHALAFGLCPFSDLTPLPDLPPLPVPVRFSDPAASAIHPDRLATSRRIAVRR